MMISRTRWIVALTVLALVASIAPSTAHAGGFYLAARGARPLGRGGAFVAGVDDPHALWYNPAGLAYSGDQLLVDLTDTFLSVDYTRIDGGGTTLPTVNGHHAYVPIPTIAGSFSIDELPNFTFGLSLTAPNAALMEWPQSITVDGTEQPAPQRYSLLSMQGSVLSTATLGVAWRPIRELSLGFSSHLLFGSFNAQVALSACDGVICSFPEDPDYDGVSQITLPVVYPYFELGGIVDLDVVRIGVSVTTPYELAGSAQIKVRPPAAAAFQGAEVVNRSAGCNYEDESAPCRSDTHAAVGLQFPWVLRAGVEVRPLSNLRIEGAVVWETWSMQQQVSIRPNDVWIQGALGGSLDYQVGPLNIPRNMSDTVSIRLGGEWTPDPAITIRAGGYWENGAFSDPYLSALTIDSDKVVMGAGVGVNVSPEVSIDALVGYIWMASRSVRNSMVPQPNPIRPPASEAETVYVGNGDYSMTAPYVGLGVRWRADAGNIRGPGEEEPERATSEAPSDEPEIEESSAPSEESAPAPQEESAPSDPSVPWYLRGRGSDAQPATTEPETVESTDAPAADEAAEPEERPARRHRRHRRTRRHRR